MPNEAAGVIYFRQDGVPGRYFTCASYGTMSVSACARNFTDAPANVRSGRLQRCIDCSVGRKHAGAPAAEKSNSRARTSIQYRVACVRCLRDGRSEGTRLLGRLRLVRDHTICVSCYNREREVIHGANAKGARPKKWASLFRTRAAYLTGTRTVVVDHPSPVSSRVELALTLMRQGHFRGVVWARPDVIRDEAGA
jgi:hypothetical protein